MKGNEMKPEWLKKIEERHQHFLTVFPYLWHENTPASDRATLLKALNKANQLIDRVDKYGQRLHATFCEDGWEGKSLQDLIDEYRAYDPTQEETNV